LTSHRFRSRGLVNDHFVSRMLEIHLSEKEDHGHRLWTLLCLELWFQTFIDTNASSALSLDVMSSQPEMRLAG
jgi:asparagine synthase (glutamine-hydrolysing)